MMQRLIILLFFLTLMLSASFATSKKPVKPITTLPTDIEPDALPAALPAARPLPRLQEVNIVRRRRSHVMGKKGIDVSHYQGRINWNAVAKNNDVNYVYIKVTEHAGLVDNMFQTNLREARKAGIPVVCYHFFSPTAAPAAQLKNLTSAVPHLNDHDLVPMIDVEVKGKKTTPEQLRNNLRQFLRGVEKFYGVKPIIYTGQNFYNKYLSGYFEDYLFMIAKYSDGEPILNGKPKFAMWQYSASGRIEGIQGAVDQSCFMDQYSIRDILIKKKK